MRMAARNSGMWLGVLWLIAATTLRADAAPAQAGPREIRQNQQAWDFQSPGSDKLPGGWRALAGRWEIVAEPEHPANRVLHQAEPANGYAWLLHERNLANFVFSVRLRTDTFSQKSRNWQLGFIFRRKAPDHYYKLRVTAANLALALVAPPRPNPVLGSRGRSLTAAAAEAQENLLVFLPLGVERDRWHTLSVECRGEAITLKLDGRDLQTLNDPGVGCGALGLFTYNTQAFFDDLHLEVESLPKLTNGIMALRTEFRPLQDRDLLLYYRLEKDGPMTLRVLNTNGKVIGLLSQGVHSGGINSFAWDGQGLNGEKAPAGWYTLEVGTDRGTRRLRVKVVR